MMYIEITVAQRPTVEYPFAVLIRNAAPGRLAGVDSQEMLCRSVRDGYLVGNGMAAGLMALGAMPRDFDHNPRLDARLTLAQDKGRDNGHGH